MCVNLLCTCHLASARGAPPLGRPASGPCLQLTVPLPPPPRNICRPKEIVEIKQFLQTARKKDAKNVKVMTVKKKNAKGVVVKFTKFKIRCS